MPLRTYLPKGMDLRESVYNSGDEDAADGAAVAADGAAVAADGAAVAADGDGAPQQVAQVRRPRDTAPKPDAAYDRDAPGKWDLRNSAEHVGNIGWLSPSAYSRTTSAADPLRD